MKTAKEFNEALSTSFHNELALLLKEANSQGIGLFQRGGERKEIVRVFNVSFTVGLEFAEGTNPKTSHIEFDLMPEKLCFRRRDENIEDAVETVIHRRISGAFKALASEIRDHAKATIDIDSSEENALKKERVATYNEIATIIEAVAILEEEM